jgi:signal transduction histidine kinase
MGDPGLVQRLASLPTVGDAPREELEWLVAHGTLMTYEAGDVVAPGGRPVDSCWVILSGLVSAGASRGVGPRRVIEWHPGDLSGMLPYSRMKVSPGDNVAERRTELLSIHVDLHAELIRECPTITAQAVHAMLDRARSFNTSDLQDEKMLALGRLAAGLAHELNNPAAVTVRSAKALLGAVEEADAAARALGGADLSESQMASIQTLRTTCAARPAEAILSPLEQADREDAIEAWLEEHGADTAPAMSLAETPITIEDLDQLSVGLSGPMLDVTLRWIAGGCTIGSLAADIERAATRISELVGAIRRFTRVDASAGPESVDVGPGLQDTLRVLAAKAREKGAAISLDVQPDLPRVRASAGELNQIWLNLIDNALDAIGDAGRVEVRAWLEAGRVAVRVIDDGPGIPPDILPNVFDPFFTTKPPGQGTGLGLEISRRLARSHRGQVTVTSEPGRTEFTVTLPAETKAPLP